MLDAHIIAGLEAKFNALASDLDERGRRRWAASEAMALGYGGITAVASATGLSRHTIHKGIRELQSDNPLPSTRQRKRGGGRKPLEVHQPELIEAIDRLVEPTERGDPPIDTAMDLQEPDDFAIRVAATGDSGGAYQARFGPPVVGVFAARES